MSSLINISRTLLLAAFVFILTSCDREDPGPLQETHKRFSVIDFDRLEMGSALDIEVEQDNTFSIEVDGDRRNLDDLEVYKSGSTLIIKFEDDANRRHNTYVRITMPSLASVNFSGASVSTIRGFESDEDLDFHLSGSSVSQLDSDYRAIEANVSGASSLLLNGEGTELNAEISGASSLKAFNYPVTKATLDVSGASEGRVTVTNELKVAAAGASSVLYRGEPVLTSHTSGASTVQKD
jgi:hypothetical protein